MFVGFILAANRPSSDRPADNVAADVVATTGTDVEADTPVSIEIINATTTNLIICMNHRINSMSKQKNKNILITGAATGMGRASALDAAKHGANLVLADINEEGLNEVSSKLDPLNCNYKIMHMDVTSIDSTEKNIASAETWFDGGINALVHFAGALEGSVVDIDEISPETWHRIININLHGTYNVTRSVAKFMKSRNSGVILLTSSGAGVNGPGSSAPYLSLIHI